MLAGFYHTTRSAGGYELSPGWPGTVSNLLPGIVNIELRLYEMAGNALAVAVNTIQSKASVNSRSQYLEQNGPETADPAD